MLKGYATKKAIKKAEKEAQKELGRKASFYKPTDKTQKDLAREDSHFRKHVLNDISLTLTEMLANDYISRDAFLEIQEMLELTHNLTIDDCTVFSSQQSSQPIKNSLNSPKPLPKTVAPPLPYRAPVQLHQRRNTIVQPPSYQPIQEDIQEEEQKRNTSQPFTSPPLPYRAPEQPQQRRNTIIQPPSHQPIQEDIQEERQKRNTFQPFTSPLLPYRAPEASSSSLPKSPPPIQKGASSIAISSPTVPSNLHKSMSALNLKSTSGLFKVICISDFESKEKGDLELQVGDIVNVLEEVDDHWYKGSKFGKTGIFPKSFVQKR